jgi:hypothetical protein
MSAPSTARSAAGGSSRAGDESVVPVFIENTRELFAFPLEHGAATRVSHLAAAVARRLRVHASTLSFRVHRSLIDAHTRLCALPDGTVVQCHCAAEQYDSMVDLDATGGSPARLRVVTSPSSGRATGRRSSGSEAAAPAAAAAAGRTPRATALNVSAASGGLTMPRTQTSARRSDAGGADAFSDAPTVVSDARSLRRLDSTLPFVGTQAQISLDASRAGDPNARFELQQPPQQLARLVTLSVRIERCDAVLATVDTATSVTDLRVRCSVSADDFPTVSCDGRRVLFEQRSFAEQCIGDGANVVFHRKTPRDWGDATDDLTRSAGRLPRAGTLLGGSPAPAMAAPSSAMRRDGASPAVSGAPWAHATPSSGRGVTFAGAGVLSPSRADAPATPSAAFASASHQPAQLSPTRAGASSFSVEPGAATVPQSPAERVAAMRAHFSTATTPLKLAAASAAAAAASEDVLGLAAPSTRAWISPTRRRAELETMEYAAARHGKGLQIRFEDPTDGGFTHELLVWSLNPVSYLFAFAGDGADERFALLCDGELVAYPSHSFALVTRGQHGCLFTFAPKY